MEMFPGLNLNCSGEQGQAVRPTPEILHDRNIALEPGVVLFVLSGIVMRYCHDSGSVR